jgi:Tfp pilus assembly protein PilZ
LAVLDLSEEGIRLRVTETLQAGQEVEVQLESFNRSRPLKVLGTVAWSVPAADGSCCIGVRFQRTIPYIDVVSFIRV